MEDTNQDSIVKVDEVVFKDQQQAVPQEETGLPLLRSSGDFITYEVSVIVPYIDGEDVNFYPIFYVPNVKCFLIEARERHTTASPAGTLMIEKLPSGTAMGSGSSMLESAFSLSSTANVTQRKGAISTFASTQLNPGDAMALKPAGTLTNIRNIAVTVLLGINLSDIPTGQSVATIISGI